MAGKEETTNFLTLHRWRAYICDQSFHVLPSLRSFKVNKTPTILVFGQIQRICKRVIRRDWNMLDTA